MKQPHYVPGPAQEGSEWHRHRPCLLINDVHTEYVSDGGTGRRVFPEEDMKCFIQSHITDTNHESPFLILKPDVNCFLMKALRRK